MSVVFSLDHHVQVRTAAKQIDELLANLTGIEQLGHYRDEVCRLADYTLTPAQELRRAAFARDLRDLLQEANEQATTIRHLDRTGQAQGVTLSLRAALSALLIKMNAVTDRTLKFVLAYADFNREVIKAAQGQR